MPHMLYEVYAVYVWHILHGVYAEQMSWSIFSVSLCALVFVWCINYGVCVTHVCFMGYMLCAKSIIIHSIYNRFQLCSMLHANDVRIRESRIRVRIWIHSPRIRIHTNSNPPLFFLIQIQWVWIRIRIRIHSKFGQIHLSIEASVTTTIHIRIRIRIRIRTSPVYYLSSSRGNTDYNRIWNEFTFPEAFT